MSNLLVERLRPLTACRADEVWEVGLVPYPPHVPADDSVDLVRPLIAVCLSSHGGVALSDPAPPDRLPRSAMLDAMVKFALSPLLPDAPILGYLPKLVRTPPIVGEAAQEFAVAMKDLGVAVEVKTELPMIGEFVAFLAEHTEDFKHEVFADIQEPPGIMHSKGMTVERVRAFADAASEFFRARPWELLSVEVLWRVEPKPATRALSHFTIMGGGGEVYGLGFLQSQAEMRRVLNSSDDPERFFHAQRTTIWSVCFNCEDEMPLSDLDLWQEESLPLAAEHAYPFPNGYAPSGRLKRPTPKQLTYMESVLRAATQMQPGDVEKKSTQFEVSTHDGPRTVTLRCVLALAEDHAGGSTQAHQGLTKFR